MTTTYDLIIFVMRIHSLMINYFIYYTQYNHIFNIKHVIHDYVISNLCKLNITQNNCPYVLFDLFHLPLKIMYSFKKCSDLEFNDYISN